MSKSRKLVLKSLVYALSVSLVFPAGPLQAALTDIANEPLAQPAASVKPNVMMLFDDSGSMRQQYTPDYLGRYFGGSNQHCFDSLDDGSSTTIGNDLDNCEAGDVPLMTPQVNTQYYNPEFRYFPAVNHDGTSKLTMNAANTANWTAVPTDAVSTGTTVFQKTTLDMHGGQGVVATVNLVTGYPDRVYCNTNSRSATDTTNCKVNSSYTYPNNVFGFSASGTKHRFGPPYYYRLLPTEHCADPSLTNCVTSTVPTGAFTIPAPVRYCNSTALTSCQANFSGSFTRPKYTGIWNNTAVTAVRATARITVKNPQSDAFSGSITAINVFDGTTTTNILVNSPPASATGPINPSTAAATIASKIGGGTYTATASSNVVTISAPATPIAPAATNEDYNGYVVTVVSPGTPITRASITFDVSGVDNNDSTNTIIVSGVNLLPAAITCTSGAGCTGGGTGRNNWMGNAIAAVINGGTTGYTASTTNGGARVTITAPTGTGAEMNGISMTITDNGLSTSWVGASSFQGGVTSGDIETTVTNFAGGVSAASAGRTQVGNFVRTNIVTGQTYPRYPNRTDCAGATCTYAEEMTNFANWYAYYRSRMQMAKTAIGRSFLGISDKFRVGFITINPGSPVNSSRYLAVNDFASGAGNQKDLWYQRLYGTTDNGSTPLREALSRVGRYYGNVTSGINSGMGGTPIQVACQPNFTILTTDGYWNGNAGQTLTGATIGNEDNVDAGWSTRSIGAYDGGTPVASGTLADVALYYYRTDLSSTLANNVPTTQKDTASHQHMTTFTVGLGLAGLLNYDQNYETQTSGDFFDIKQGSKNWPVPAANAESALDDLWHAAVNGRGQFFSAKDPVQLSNSINETLNAVNSRVGAGAAAATSNLQPVAGDNFAFTAQYQTVEWTGDIKARTIDLNSGIVATRELWSAQVLLDQRSHTGRRIYTYHAADTSAPATGNGNRLKAFCWPGATGTGLYPGCAGEAELSATEMNDFDPLTLTQALPWPTDGSGRNVSATKQNLVDYLRGDTANEMSGGSLPSDLYRNRAHLLGDIVNAQPAYVKGAPFGYDAGTYAGTDPYYQDFRKSTDGTTGTRIGTVFVASNDGMLHAFETDPDNNPYYQTAGISTTVTSDDTFTGTLSTDPVSGEGAERWAYIPTMVRANLKQLAESPYTHRYFVDGSPVVGDVCFGHTAASRCSSQANWRTLLVAGLNAGGRGYYALDVTDPANPKAVWELKGGTGTACLTNAQANSGTFFEDCNIGLTYGNPVITKRKSDGKWVVLLTSGYNNVNPGSGQGHLYVVDAQTGAILNRLDTGVGCDGVSTTAPCVAGTVDPSGLGKINTWVNAAFNDNTSLRAYAGDMKGNVWRFQLDPAEAGYLSAVKLATLTDAGGATQAITTKPELGEVQGFAVVFVGTGRLLGTSDKTTTQSQTIYAIRDDLVDNNIAPRSGGAFVQQSMSALGPDQRTATGSPVDFNVKKGWLIDLPDSGERVNVDPVLQLGTLVVASNVPSTDTCVAGGYGWLNFLDFKSGTFVPGATANMASTKIAASLIVGINVVQLPGGKIQTIVTTADNQQLTRDTPVSPPSVTGRRVSWRELIAE